jgi:hypothetical protein
VDAKTDELRGAHDVLAELYADRLAWSLMIARIDSSTTATPAAPSCSISAVFPGPHSARAFDPPLQCRTVMPPARSGGRDSL